MYSHEQSTELEQGECQLHIPPHDTSTAERYFTQNVAGKSVCSSQSYFLAPVPASLHMSSRVVPDVAVDSGCRVGPGLESTGIDATSVHDPPNTYPHPYMELPAQKDLFDCQPEENCPSQLACYQDEPVSSCDGQYTRNQLYDFEDGLRHKINVYIEDFRMGLQHTVTEGFREYRSPIHRAAKWRRCGSLEGTCHQEAEGAADSVDRDTVSSETHSMDYHSGNMEQLIDQELIQLQTHAAVITRTLRRSEYHQDSPQKQ